MPLISPGAAASDAILEVFARQAQERQQALLNEYKAKAEARMQQEDAWQHEDRQEAAAQRKVDAQSRADVAKSTIRKNQMDADDKEREQYNERFGETDILPAEVIPRMRELGMTRDEPGIQAQGPAAPGQPPPMSAPVTKMVPTKAQREASEKKKAMQTAIEAMTPGSLKREAAQYRMDFGVDMPAGALTPKPTGRVLDRDPRSGKHYVAGTRTETSPAFEDKINDLSFAPQGSGSGAGGGVGSSERAAMVAANPAELQGITASERGKIMNEIAANPELLQVYTESRMRPAKDKATMILGALGKLVTVDAKNKGSLTLGAQRLFGERTPVMFRDYMPEPEATDANAALKQVAGEEVLRLISEMKAQSKTGATGFGAMNLQELALLESSATKLKNRMSEEGALEELMGIRDKLTRFLQPDPSSMGLQIPGGAGGAAPDINALWNEFQTRRKGTR